MTTANKLTILRVLMIPVFLVVLYWGFPGCRYVALGIYIVACLTDLLDGYIARYAKGWNFARIPLVASAIMRVAMYEMLYMADIPAGVAINEAVEIAKHYESPEVVKFINGILGSFARGELKE